MNISAERLKEAYRLISEINQRAYGDLFLISNQVLSKNPYSNNFLNRFLKYEKPHKHAFYGIAYKFVIYYIKNILHFLLYLFKFIEYYLSGLRFDCPNRKKELVLIDIFYSIDRIRETKNFTNTYLPGIEKVLEKRNKDYAYLPFFYSRFNNKMPFELYATLKILKKNKVPVICEYQILSFFDLCRLAHFIVTYPFHVLKFANTLTGINNGAALLRCELIDTVSEAVFYNFARYLQGKRLAKLPYGKITLISWYENQPLHKNLYKGIRDAKADIKIYGAKLSLGSQNYLNEIPDENEDQFGVIPDYIIVNGPDYIPEKSGFNYRVGPSLRYSKIFNTLVKDEKQKNILLLLPYFDDEIRNILRIAVDCDLFSFNVLIKPHPAVKIDKYRIPQRFHIVDGDVYKLFETTKIVVGAATTTLIEAASLGIPAILIKNGKHFDYSNPFPEEGKGLIWDEAGDSNALAMQVKKFEYRFKNRKDDITAIADKYKRAFFSPISEDNIIRAFDL